MAVFEYTAKDEHGNKFSGVYDDVGSISALRDELTKLGYALVKARRQKTPAQKKGKVKQTDVVTFTYKFAGMCSAGLSIARCLEVLEQQSENQAMKYISSDIRQRVETGSSLKDAFSRHQQVFSDFFLGMLEAGETGGKLSKTLELAAAYLEKQADLRRKIKAAFAYPAIVGVMSFLIIGYLVVVVVPVFSKIYGQMHVSLPGPTQALVILSQIARKYWPFMLLLGAGGVAFFRKFSHRPEVRARWDTFKLNMPVFAKLNRMVVVSRFVRTFAMLASAGVSYIKALSVASLVADNCKVVQIAEGLKEDIERGNPVAGSMGRYDLFPPMIVQLAASGEEAGVLPEMLNKGVDFLDKDIDRTINSLLVKLEPALTVIMGTIVGFILMGVYLPMFDYMSHLK
jgi:type IV pilus assembly protein PilC